MRSATKLALCAAAGLYMAGPLAAQDAGATNDAADALYCAERKLGYWFYCVRPAPTPRETEPQPQASTSAAEELDAITGTLALQTLMTLHLSKLLER